MDVGYMYNNYSPHVILLTNDTHMVGWKDIPISSLFAVLDFLCSPSPFLTDIRGNFTAGMILCCSATELLRISNCAIRLRQKLL